MPIFGDGAKSRVYLRRKSLRLQNLSMGLSGLTALVLGCYLVAHRHDAGDTREEVID